MLRSQLPEFFEILISSRATTLAIRRARAENKQIELLDSMLMLDRIIFSDVEDSVSSKLKKPMNLPFFEEVLNSLLSHQELKFEASVYLVKEYLRVKESCEKLAEELERRPEVILQIVKAPK